MGFYSRNAFDVFIEDLLEGLYNENELVWKDGSIIVKKLTQNSQAEWKSNINPLILILLDKYKIKDVTIEMHCKWFYYWMRKQNME